MSTEQLKNQIKAEEKKNIPINQRTIGSLMNDPIIKQQIQHALPKHLTADRLARIAMTEIRRTPALANSSQESFLGAILQCAQLGLEPGNILGHAYLLPFGNGKDKNNRSNVQLIIGYRGMIDLARRSGQIQSISARTVRAKDVFSYEYGLHEDLKHIPCEDEEPGEITHVYAVARLKDGGIQFEVMSRKQVEKVRSQSPASSKGPWVTHFEEMAKKTVIRRLFKYLPVSIEIQQAIGLDEQAEAGIDQKNQNIIISDDVIDADFSIEEPNNTHEPAETTHAT